ncbi:hypothetical protein K443DRAFT_684045 [Laccaria amethystina LaAM-08-1]|uniref:Uncharacterized protein n=1 Tax=Laccaria amethystina LaAM-08-1 TaxID=1095629 RepID=A0A0C9WJ54_9AGAR|nr:hypothetical protein K443DRAFT_684045 [Laccaria amethystina LaAM-08-1]
MSFMRIWTLKKPFFSLDSELNPLKSRVMRPGNTVAVVSDTADFDMPQFQANPIRDIRNTGPAFSHFFPL